MLIYGENHTAFYNPRQFGRLCERLEGLKQEATDLGELLDGMFERWRVAAGVSDEELNEGIRTAIEGWKSETESSSDSSTQE